jgi:hypothetical protein
MPYAWDVPSDSEQVEQAPEAAPEQDSALASQVERLSDEVASLRDEQALRNTPGSRTSAPPEAAAEKPVPAIIVYRDGHRSQVENYAIQGQTLWVFSGQTTRKISLADLDLPATKRANEERGIDFLAPDSQ